MESHHTDYRTIFNAMPGASALILPDSPEFTVVGATTEFAAFAGAQQEDLINQSLFRFFPDNPDAPIVSNDIRTSLNICINTKKKNEIAVQRYDIANAGTFYEMYWTVIHTPILDENSEIVFIIHTTVNITEHIAESIRDEKMKSLEPAQNLFMQSSVAIHIFKGPDAIIEFANEPTLTLWDREESIIGKPLREVLPELATQKYLDIIDRVRLTGIRYQEHEAPVILHRNGRDEVGYFNFVLQPYFEKGVPKPTGVIAMVSEVTDIYNDRKQLKEKERTLELAVEIGGLGIFNVNIPKGTIDYSQQMTEWFGIENQDHNLEHLLSKIHPDDHKLVRDTFLHKVEGENLKHDITFRLNDAKTDDIIFLRSIGQVQIVDGIATTLSGIIQNVSAAVKSTLALEQSAQRLKSVIESAPFPIGVYIDREMRIEMANKAILDVWRKGDVIGRLFEEVLPELEGQGPYEQLVRVYETGEDIHFHNQRIDLQIDNVMQTFYFNYSFTPLFDTSGKVYGVMNTAADVTDLNIANQTVERSEKYLRNIILQAPVAMCLLREPLHIVEVANDAMITLWGKDRSEVINKPIFTGLPDAKEQGLELILANVFHKGETFSANEMPVKLVRFGNPETLYLNFVYEPYRDVKGEVSGILAIAIDVTAQVVARQQIEETVKERTLALEIANEHLKRSNAELEQFAYIASHDLQEPLRKISMYSEMLESSLINGSEQDRQNLQRIGKSVFRMMNLIRDILSYSQLAATTDLFMETNLEDVFTEAVADFDFVLMEKSGKITHTGLGTIEAIPLQMVQLFNNLISNSLKYSRPDVPPLIMITGNQMTKEEIIENKLPNAPAGYLKIIFKDNGIGFQQAYVDRIFSIFQRLHGKSQYEGTGIGLAMCKKIIDNHQGLISAFGKEDEGAEFVVILPVKQPYL